MAGPEDEMARRRRRMVEEVEAEVRATARYLGKDHLDPRVVSALGEVPREAFVPPHHAGEAYVNAPLPIGRGQTISQPYIVAVMTDMVVRGPQDRVLEIGTGCGYQAAVLARVAAEVFSVEFIEELGRAAERRLAGLGIANVHVRIGDGNEGWVEHAPYDGILVTASPPSVPPALVDQLRRGGRMAIPVGPQGGGQQLMLVTKDENGAVAMREVLPVAFVPLVSG